MDMNAHVQDALDYTRDALWQKWGQWVLFLVAYIVFPLFMGYTVRVYRGESPAPPLDNWVDLFIDGIKLLIIGILYAIPVGIVAITSAVLVIPVLGDTFAHFDIMAILALIAVAGMGIMVILIAWLVVLLLQTIGTVRFARSGLIREAFNFHAILDDIRRIGWGNYALALTVLGFIWLVVHSCIFFINSLPVVGWLIGLFLAPAWGIYSVRFIASMYAHALESTAPLP